MGYSEEEGTLNGSLEVGPGLLCPGGDGGCGVRPSQFPGVRLRLVGDCALGPGSYRTWREWWRPGTSPPTPLPKKSPTDSEM